MYKVEWGLDLAPAEPQGDCDQDDRPIIFDSIGSFSVFASQLRRNGHPKYHADHCERSKGIDSLLDTLPPLLHS